MGIKSVDIARMLSISPAAVSLARNNKPGVSEQTRRNVMQILRNNGVQTPSDGGEERCIMLVMHKTHGQVIRNTPFFQNMLESIQHIATAAGYQLLVLNYSSQYDLDEHIEKISNSSAEGVLLLASEMSEKDYQPYKALNKPIVVVDAHFPDENVDIVGIDNEFLIRLALKHAVDMGHTQIGFLASYVFTYNFEDRLRAFRNGMADMGRTVDPAQIFYLHSTAEKAYIDMREQLAKIDLRELPTAFIAGNDLLAMGAMKALKEAGLRIPEDISIVSFDNMPVTSVLEPPLTSIDINSKDMDALAIDSLLSKINHTSIGCCRKDVRGSLKIRESVRRL